jgi:hypothetical protein
MTLPKISTPTYELELISINKTITYRPFLVGEEKILIIAKETEDPVQIANAVKTVLSNCILTKGVDVNSLATFDLEYLFLNTRCKSVGELVDLQIICPDDGKTVVPISINLDDIKIVVDENHTKDIKLDDTYSMRLKYPSMDNFLSSNFDIDAISASDTFEVILSCIEQIYTDEEAWVASDYTKKELEEFIDSLGKKSFEKIKEFFKTIPKLYYEMEVTNPETKKKHKIRLQGLKSFLA